MAARAAVQIIYGLISSVSRATTQQLTITGQREGLAGLSSRLSQSDQVNTPARCGDAEHFRATLRNACFMPSGFTRQKHV